MNAPKPICLYPQTLGAARPRCINTSSLPRRRESSLGLGALKLWIPAFAGMTKKRTGMTTKGTGMTKKGTGMTMKGAGMTLKGAAA